LGRSTATNADHTPLAVTVLTGAYSELTPGGESVCYIQNNEMKCWGDNVYGQLNRFTPDTIVNPVSIFGPTVTAIEVSGSNGCAVRNGSLTCWGSNYYGQLGTGVAGEPFVKIGETLINL
jgi:alpha-tubulin suppressor-like RCC1 family protein